MTKKFKSESDRLIYESIQKLKLEASSRNGVKFNAKSGDPCWIWILNRGEQLFFCTKGKAIICEISTAYDFLEVKSIKKWDDGTKISDDEKRIILQTISDFWLSRNGTKIKLLGKGGKEISEIQSA